MWRSDILKLLTQASAKTHEVSAFLQGKKCSFVQGEMTDHLNALATL